MAKKQQKYDMEYKVQAVKLAKELGGAKAAAEFGILQSINSAGGRCHDNARCESMWARMKEELLYDRHNTEEMTIEELKTLIWRYFISYWNNRRICSANEGLPPMVRRQRYYESLGIAA